MTETHTATLLVKHLRKLRDLLLVVGRQTTDVARKQVAGAAAARLDRLATRTLAGKTDRKIIDNTFAHVMLMLAMDGSDVFSELLDQLDPAGPDSLNLPK